MEHHIPLVPGAQPIWQPARRFGHEKELEVENQIREGFKKQGVIVPGNRPWSSPVVLDKKKDNSWRFGIDYRRLNDVTQHDALPLPRIDKSLKALAGGQYFSN